MSNTNDIKNMFGVFIRYGSIDTYRIINIFFEDYGDKAVPCGTPLLVKENIFISVFIYM